MSNDLSIPDGVTGLQVSKETFDTFAEEFLKKVVEEAVPSGSFGGIQVSVHPYIDKNTILMVGPDPDFPCYTRVVKIVKFTP